MANDEEAIIMLNYIKKAKTIKIYTQELRKYGISHINLKKLPLSYWNELMEIIRLFNKEFPNILTYLYGIFDTKNYESFVFIYYPELFMEV